MSFLCAKTTTISKMLFCVFLITASVFEASVDSSTFVLLSLEQTNKQTLFPHIIAPINFLVLAPTPGVLPLNNPIKINPLSSYVVLDITNTLILIDETCVENIVQKLGIEKKIIAHCSAQDLLRNNTNLYHPTNNILIPLIPCEINDHMDTLGRAVDGNFIIEKKLVIIVTSYNNKDWYKKNLDSVFMQNYTNYRMIYIDDHSPDGTGKLVQSYIKEKDQEYRTTLLLQPEWKSQMANHYYGVYMCDDDEIACHLDGDDWLYDNMALNTVNKIYFHDIWITYGGSLHSTGDRPLRASDEAIQKVIQRNTYRSEGYWGFSHFRTFYAWLFKSLKLQDLVYKGNFANMAPAPDVAMMYPMLEMAGFRTQLIDRDVYIVNKKNPISQCNITPYQVISELDRTIKSTWPIYEPLYKPAINRIADYENKQADLVMWAENLSLELSATLKAIQLHLTHLNTLIIIYDKSTCSEKELLRFKNEFPTCQFLDYDQQNTHFKSLLDYLLTITSDYLIFTSPDFVLAQDRDISYCIKELEQTFAYGFYLHLNLCDELKALYAPLSDEIIAWQPGYTKQVWAQPNKLGMILYRKKDIALMLKNITCKTIHQFKELWAHQQMPERTVSLFFR